MDERNSKQQNSGKSAAPRKVKFIAGYRVELEGNAIVRKDGKESGDKPT